MPATHFFAKSPEEVGLDSQKVQALFERAEREVKEGILPACQVAIARNGKIGAMQTFGRAVQGGVRNQPPTIRCSSSCPPPRRSARPHRGC